MLLFLKGYAVQKTERRGKKIDMEMFQWVPVIRLISYKNLHKERTNSTPVLNAPFKVGLRRKLLYVMRNLAEVKNKKTEAIRVKTNSNLKIDIILEPFVTTAHKYWCKKFHIIT